MGGASGRGLIVGEAHLRGSCGRDSWVGLVGGTRVGGAYGRDSWVGLVGGTHVGGASERDLCGRGLWESSHSLAPNVRMVESGHKTRAHVEAHVGGGAGS